MAELGALFQLLWDVLRWAVRPPFRLGNLLAQLDFVGAGSVFLVTLTGTFTGMVFAHQTGRAFELFDAESLVGPTVALTLSRELAPVFSALMVTMRAGSSMCTELGTMRVTEQVDALETLAYDPMAFLVVPRVLAGTCMFPVVVALAMLVGVAAGWAASVLLLDLSSQEFARGVRLFFQTFDVRYGVVKAASFGLAVTLVGARHGLGAEGGAQGVGRAATGAVVSGAILILVLDAFWAVTWLLGRRP